MDKINKNHLDPVIMYPTAKIQLMLRREELVVPELNDNAEEGEKEEEEEQYSERLIQVIAILRMLE